ncbi:uncharacterized protein [Diadema antillarum]|uniref:uncharacterized protein n=1 Tax=Diadema antillarum TaxID=105358 RepID=UPI003A896B65
MPRSQNSGFWRVKSGIFLLPPIYRNGDTYPNEKKRAELERKRYGTCSFESGLDRTWTCEELEENIISKYSRHADALRVTGIIFAKLEASSKQISVHRFLPLQTVAELEAMHGSGVLVLLSRPPDVIQQDLTRLWECDGMTIGHLNCQSLSPKIDELRLLLFRTNVDVMTLSETWLKRSIKNDSLAVAGYRIVARRDGPEKSMYTQRPRGGVMVYVKEELEERGIHAREYMYDTSLEVVCVELDFDQPTKHRKSTKQSGQTTCKGRGRASAAAKQPERCQKRTVLRILDVYIPPGTRDQISALKKLHSDISDLKEQAQCRPLLREQGTPADVPEDKGTKCRSGKGAGGTTKGRGGSSKGQKCHCKAHYVILGDFNCNIQDADAAAKQISTVEAKLRTLKEIEDSCHLKQLIKDPTRTARRKYESRGKENVSETTIDLIYTDSNAKVKSGVIRVSLSDHFMVYCSVTVPGGNKKKICKDKKSTGNRDQEALRKFTSEYPRSKINKNVFQLIKDRDLAHANSEWDDFDRLRHEVKRLT